MEWVVALSLGVALGILAPQARRHWLSTVAWLVIVIAVTFETSRAEVAWLGFAGGASTIGAAVLASMLFARRDEPRGTEGR